MFIWLIPTIIIVGFSLFTVSRVFGGLRKASQDRLRILQTGYDAQGQVLTVQQTGTFINGNPEVIVYLAVMAPTGQQYQATVKMVIQMVAAAWLQPGAAVPIKVDPANAMNVAINLPM